MPTDPKKLKQAEETLKKINAIYRELGKASIGLNTKDIEDYPDILKQAKIELADGWNIWVEDFSNTLKIDNVVIETANSETN